MEIYSNGIKQDLTLKYEFIEKGKKSLIIMSKENITNMNGMFFKCSSLSSLNLSNFNTNNVTDMSYMFSGLNENCDIITLDNHLLEELAH